MNLARERKAIDAALDNYRAQIDEIPDEWFTETPAEGAWSFAEVYSHIMQATLGSSIAMERCVHNNCEPTLKGLTFLGRWVLFTGRFPPVKVKVPPSVHAKYPVVKVSKEDAKNLIIKCRKRLEGTMHLIKEAPPNARFKHPRMGMLDAAQWLKFIRIHLQHHLKQLERIRKNLQAR